MNNKIKSILQNGLVKTINILGLVVLAFLSLVGWLMGAWFLFLTGEFGIHPLTFLDATGFWLLFGLGILMLYLVHEFVLKEDK